MNTLNTFIIFVKLIIFFSLIRYHFSYSFGQQGIQNVPVFEVDLLKDDLETLWNLLEESHGRFDRYTSLDTLKASFNSFSSQIENPMTEIIFYKKLLPIISQVKDGHTQMRLSPPAIRMLNEQNIFLPFELRFINNKAFVIYDMSAEYRLKEGSEILSINNIPVRLSPVPLQSMVIRKIKGLFLILLLNIQ